VEGNGELENKRSIKQDKTPSVLERDSQGTKERCEGSENVLEEDRSRQHGVWQMRKGQTRLLLGTIKTQGCGNDPVKPPPPGGGVGGSADRKSIDIVRHQVEKRPQKPMRSDAPNSADTEPSVQPANAR